MFLSKYLYILLFFLTTSVAAKAFGLSHAARRHKYIAGGVAVCALIGGSYGLYSWWCKARPDIQVQKMIEAEVQTTTEDTIVDMVLLTLKPRSNCCESDLIRKARLEQLKKEVIVALPKTPEFNIYRTGTSLIELGVDFAQNIRLTPANPYANSVQALEWQNLFKVEKTWMVWLFTAVAPSSTVRNRVRDEIVRSIELLAKPLDQCTPAQKAIRAETVERRMHILEKLNKRIVVMNEEEFKTHFVPTITLSSSKPCPENEGWFKQLGRTIKKGLAQQTQTTIQAHINELITKDLVLAAVAKGDTLIALFDPVN